LQARAVSVRDRFFTVEAVTSAGLVRFQVLFVIELATRRVEIAGIYTNLMRPETRVGRF